MKILDLTHPITKGMPVYPGTPEVNLFPLATVNEDGFLETRLELTSHTGTHVDAPSHILPGAPDIEGYPLSAFTGSACCLRVDVTRITAEWLQAQLPDPSKSDFLIFFSGWDRFWGRSEYYADYPALTPAAAQWLAGFTLKGVGMDTPSPDPADSRDFPAHRALLSGRILILENLTNLGALPEGDFRLSAFPLNITGIDGSPVRAVALLD